MFNLIVSGSGWKKNKGTIPRDRVFEYTDEHLDERFKPEGNFDFQRLTELPTLFMTESGGDSTPLARIGLIHRIVETGSDLNLEYSYDDAVAGISNATIAELADELGVGKYEFMRTHWAVKGADLYAVLLRRGQSLPNPSVFRIGDEPIDENLVSVMMPFDAAFNSVFSAVENAARSAGKRCRRADNIWVYDAIIQDIVSLIQTSSTVICDLSHKNANVFYETGIAHTLGKPVIMITQNADDVPFDLRHLRYIQYHNNNEGRLDLAKKILDRLRTLSRIA